MTGQLGAFYQRFEHIGESPIRAQLHECSNQPWFTEHVEIGFKRRFVGGTKTRVSQPCWKTLVDATTCDLTVQRVLPEFAVAARMLKSTPVHNSFLNWFGETINSSRSKNPHAYRDVASATDWRLFIDTRTTCTNISPAVRMTGLMHRDSDLKLLHKLSWNWFEKFTQNLSHINS